MESKDGENIVIPMEMFMKVNGRTMLKMAKALCGTLTRTNMKEIGRKERKMESESTSTTMALSIKEILSMEGKTVLAPSPLQMEQEFKPTGTKLMSKVKVKCFILTVIFSRDNIKCPKSMAKVYMFGAVIILNMKANLKKTLYREKLGYILLKDKTTLVVYVMEKEKAKAITFTKMEILLMENGKMT